MGLAAIRPHLRPVVALAATLTCLTATSIALHAQAASTGHPSSTVTLKTGKKIWEAGCASCHGVDGRGQAENLRGFELPPTFPDFSDCPTSTPESNLQWRSVITNGGHARGFSTIMPSFRDLLTQEQIGMVISHIRSLCNQTSWPLGDLNLPRPMVTEKAFPENETVIAGSVNAQGRGELGSTVIYEHRIGSRAMMEAIVPYAFSDSTGTWGAAFGDLALGYKRTMAQSAKHGSIFSLGGELIAPTGNRQVGTGGDSTVFEGYAAYGQILPRSSFVQLHAGLEVPARPERMARAAYLRSAIGKTFATDSGLGRRWTPMLEVIGDREFESGLKTNWDVIPELQIPVNRRMHLLASVGYRIPVNNTDGRPRQVLFYGIWDWMDGGLRQGW